MSLKGKVFISTVYSHKSAEIRNIFEPLGATVIDFPLTEIRTTDLSSSLKNILLNIENYNWVVFTSSNGVTHLLKLLSMSGRESKIPSHIKTAAVGIKTARELEKNGHKADFTGTGHTAENLVKELMEKEALEGTNILLPLGNLAPDTLEKRLSGTANVTRINVYNTIKTDISDDEPVRRIKSNQYDLVLFTSPSGVANFINAIGSVIKKSGLRAASIGRVTTHAAERSGITCLVTASKSTYEGLADEIVKYYTKK
jgi:uroporphyrinogen-III synthase